MKPRLHRAHFSPSPGEGWGEAFAATIAPLSIGACERSDELVRKGEGLPAVSGALAGDEPPDEMPVTENGARYVLDIKSGRQTKFR